MKNKNRILLLSTLTGLILVVLGFFYLANTNKTTTSPGTSNSQKANSVKQSQPVLDGDSDESASQNNTSADSGSIPTDDSLSVLIDSVSQTGGRIVSSATTNGSGTCVFSFTIDGDRPVVKETDVTNNSCSVSIPEVEFSKLGTWKLKVTYFSKNLKAEAEQSVAIQ